MSFGRDIANAVGALIFGWILVVGVVALVIGIGIGVLML